MRDSQATLLPPKCPPRSWCGSSLVHRSVSILVFIVSGTVLVIAWSLDPEPAGFGTHQQMGLPVCGFLLSTAIPCVTCGMTTSFAHAADGHIIEALVTNPAGAILAILTSSIMVLSAYSLVAGFSIVPIIKALWNRYSLIFFMVIVVASWVYKILSVRGVL